MSAYLGLVKLKIVRMIVITGVIGYALGYSSEYPGSLNGFIFFFLGLAIISAGSLALNSTQEWKYDQLMDRTKHRPLPQKKISVREAFLVSIILVGIGMVLLYLSSPMSAWLGLLTFFLYNVLYTQILKRRSPFAAIPGAIPGAMPVVIGYSAVNPHILSVECLYAFSIMFLWQMPHFWSLAIRYMEDYKKGGYPVLPVVYGKEKTLFHIGTYMVPYIGLAFISPLFVEAGYFYYLSVIPLAFISSYEFYRFFKKSEDGAWLRFFVWINTSMVVFLLAPVLDKWLAYFGYAPIIFW